MTKSLKTGDKVTWDTSQGTTSGRVVEKITKPAKVKGHTANASPDAPQYKVKSDRTDALAIHKPDSLTKRH